MYRGCLHATLGPDGRLTLPALFRQRLLCAGGPHLVLLLRPERPGIWLIPQHLWKQTFSGPVSPGDKGLTPPPPALGSGPAPCFLRLDARGRLRIPPILRQAAGLGRELVLLGAGDRLEILGSAAASKSQPALPPDLCRKLAFPDGRS